MAEKAGVKTYKTRISYSRHVSEEARNAVRKATKELQQRVKKNRQFFDNLYINVCQNATDAAGDEYSLGDKFRKSDIMSQICLEGLTTHPEFMDKQKEVIVRTGNRWFFNWGEEFTPSKIKGILYHELGHQFDFAFTKPDKELLNIIKQLGVIKNEENITNEEWKQVSEFEKKSGLSDTEEFKKAWQKDATIIGKTLTKEVKRSGIMGSIIDICAGKKKENGLGYFSPDSVSGIDISDGVDDNEVEEADRERSETFAQLFAYALGANPEVGQKPEQIKNAYKNCFEVVKKFITKYFGIQFEQEKSIPVL